MFFVCFFKILIFFDFLRAAKDLSATVFTVSAVVLKGLVVTVKENNVSDLFCVLPTLPAHKVERVLGTTADDADAVIMGQHGLHTWNVNLIQCLPA